MYAIRSYYALHFHPTEYLLCLQNNYQATKLQVSNRITSYNVCYTKLLRDVNLGASYSYLDWFTMFFKVNNILNKHYQNFYGYDVQGLNVMVGAILSF